MHTLVANTTGKAVRKKMGGRSFLVAPVTMIVPGVLNGSKGPVLYEPKEIKKHPEAWNGMPITNGHPKKGKRFVSARTPEVFSEWGLGTIYNATVTKDDLLRAEAWFDEELVTSSDEELLNNLLTGVPMELSTGLDMDMVKAGPESVYNAVSYDFVATNFRPDHLAILVHDKGACSIEDGCGVFNKENGGKQNEEVTNNELSHDQIRSALREGLQSQFTQADSSVWVYDVYDKFFIYEQSGKLFKMGYTNTETDVSLVGTAEEVVRDVNFLPVTNEESQETTMNKEELIAELVTNGCGCWGEDDKPTLNKMTVEKLEKLVANSKKSAENEVLANTIRKGYKDENVEIKFDKKSKKLVVNKLDPDEEEGSEGEDAEDVGGEDSVTNKKAGNATTKTPKWGSVKEWFNDPSSAPTEVKQLVRNSINNEKRHRKQLMEKLTANARDEEHAERLVANYGDLATDKLEAIVEDFVVANKRGKAADLDDDDFETENNFIGQFVQNSRGRRREGRGKLDQDDILLTSAPDFSKTPAG